MFHEKICIWERWVWCQSKGQFLKGDIVREERTSQAQFKVQKDQMITEETEWFFCAGIEDNEFLKLSTKWN